MEKQRTYWKLDVEPAACIWLAAAVLFVPLRWLLCWLIAVLVHELCHYWMILITGGEVTRICIGVRGAVMQTQFQSRGREVLCAVAGPIGGLLLLLFARWLPAVALCGLVQSLYNLIPIYPYDGGRVLEGILCLLVPCCSEWIMKWVRTLTICLIIGAGIYGALILRLGWAPVILAAGILLRTVTIKIPCKQARIGVQ